LASAWSVTPMLFVAALAVAAAAALASAVAGVLAGVLALAALATHGGLGADHGAVLATVAALALVAGEDVAMLLLKLQRSCAI